MLEKTKQRSKTTGASPQKRDKNKKLARFALLTLATVGVIVISPIAVPLIGLLLKSIDPVNPHRGAQRLKRALRDLVRQGLVSIHKNRTGQTYRLNKNGVRKAFRVRFEAYEMPSPPTWDGQWRVVCFDVPEKQRHTRTLISVKLGELGFYRLQDSLFIYPYPCDEFVRLAYDGLGLRPHLRYLLVRKIDDERLLLKHFKLRRE